MEVFLLDKFSTSGIVSSFALLLWLTGSWIVPSPVTKVSEGFFILFLLGIRCWSEVTLDTLSICPEKTEILKSSLLISISKVFNILVLFTDKLVVEIDFFLLTVFSVSFLWVDLYLSNDFPLSDLIMLDVSTFLLGACDFSVLLTV